MSKEITIITELDGKTFKADSDQVKRSGFLKNLLAQFPDEVEFKIPQIKGNVMEHILEWLEKHKSEEPKMPPVPMIDYDLDVSIGKWEHDYIKKVFNRNFDSLWSFMNATNFLDIPPLLELAAVFTASIVKDFPVDDLKKLFKIEEDATEDELKELEKEVLKEIEEEEAVEKKRQEEEDRKKEEDEKEKEKEEKEKEKNEEEK